MKKIILFLTLLTGAGATGWSHEAPIPLNHMQWVVDAGLLRVHFHANGPWWGLNVFGDRVPPPTIWPIDMETAAKTYFDQHFILKADGQTLPSHFVSHRFSEEVWRYQGGSQLDLDFYYVLPSSAQVISGQATFYKEEKAEHPDGRFETTLKIDGAPSRTQTLTLDHPDFSFAFGHIVRSSAQRWRDAWMEGLGFWQSAPWLALAFCAFQLQWRTRAATTLYYAGLAAASLLSATLMTLHGALNSGYGAGLFMALAMIALAVEIGLRVYRRRLNAVSESQASSLFTSQIRFVSLLLVGMTLFLLAQQFQNPS